MSMPALGQDPWGTDLNNYLASLAARITSLETTKFVVQTYSYQFSNQPPPATGSQVRLDNANPALATHVNIRNLDNDSKDNSGWFSLVVAGSLIRIRDWDNAGNYAAFTATGPAVVSASDTTIPVSSRGVGGVIPNAKCMVLIGVTLAI